MTTEHLFSVVCLHKDDLRALLRDPATGKLSPEICRSINALSDEDMRRNIAKMKAAFWNTCYWDVLEAIYHSFSPTAKTDPPEVALARSLPRSGCDEAQEVKP